MPHISQLAHCTYGFALTALGGSTAAEMLYWGTNFHILLKDQWQFLDVAYDWFHFLGAMNESQNVVLLRGFINHIKWKCICPLAIACVCWIDLNQLIKLGGPVSLHISIVAWEHYIMFYGGMPICAYVCVCVYACASTQVLQCRIPLFHCYQGNICFGIALYSPCTTSNYNANSLDCSCIL